MSTKTVGLLEALNVLREGLDATNPTVIYNEGWMTRLLVNQSIKEKLCLEDAENHNTIDFGEINSWGSEALIGSPFVQKVKNREGYTHTDIVFGDFTVPNYKVRAEISVNGDAKLLGIIEAKMGHNLDKRTTNAPNYNQASRSICCLAENALKSATNCDIVFMIAAPQATITKYDFRGQIGLVKKQIEDRFNLSEIPYPDELRKKVEECKTLVISYEDWIGCWKTKTAALYKFYDECLEFNRVPKIKIASATKQNKMKTKN